LSCGDKRHACHLSYRYSVGSVDIIGMLVDIYGSTDLFLNEYRSLLSDKLLALTSYQIDREVHNVELLKIRFGEVGYIMCRRMSCAVSCVRYMTDDMASVMCRRMSCGLSSSAHIIWPIISTSSRLSSVPCITSPISCRLYHVMSYIMSSLSCVYAPGALEKEMRESCACVCLHLLACLLAYTCLLGWLLHTRMHAAHVHPTSAYMSIYIYTWVHIDISIDGSV